MRISAVIVAIGLLVLASSSQARTWRVEKDGSGDFTVIQSAVDAAASGDTISIGRGRFDEKHVVSCPGWTEYVRVLITVPELTLIGSGSETIIGGSEPYSLSQGDDRGIVAGIYWSNSKIHIHNMSFRNMAVGINAEDVLNYIDSCCFSGNRYATLCVGGRSEIAGCRFEDIVLSGAHVDVFNQAGTSVRNCEFAGANEVPNQVNISFNWCNNVIVEACAINGSSLGVGFGFPSTGVVRQCVFDAQTRFSVWANQEADVVIEDCVIHGSRIGIMSSHSSATLRVQRCAIENVTDSSIVIDSTSPGTVVRNCDLAKGARYAVRTTELFSVYPTYYLDFRDNYWGTDSADSIRSWIYDQNDGLTTNYVIRYSPFESESTPTEQASWGAVKSLFR